MKRMFSLKRWGLVVCLLFVFAGLFSAEAAAFVGDVGKLERVLIESCLYERSADISQYELSRSELENVWEDLWYSGRLPWYHSGCRFDYNGDSGLVLEFIPLSSYSSTPERVQYEQKVAEILDECVLDGMSQYQIALSVHDYLVEHVAYDKTLAKHTCYDALVDGTAVCVGYAKAYQDLLTRVGIPCVYVRSDSMNHAWNLVCIDGDWYHVDVTWDDPTPDVFGYVSHDYFLLTDDEISSGDNPHYGWDCDIVCTNDKFSNAYWRDVYSRVCFLDNESCVLLRTSECLNRIYLRDEASGKETLMYKEKKASINIGYGKYLYPHQGLSLQNGRIYFSGMDRVLSMKLDGTDVETEYRYDAAAEEMFIRGCSVVGDTVRLSLSDHSGNSIRPMFAALEGVDCHMHQYRETVRVPTCTESGATVYCCDCGVTFECCPVEAAGHRWEETGVGFLGFLWRDGERVCTECGEVMEREEKLGFIGWIVGFFC